MLITLSFNNSDIFEAYGFVYITTNLVNGKRYIGQSKFKKNWDTYYGSGKLIIRAISKYGKENFVKNIIYIAASKEELDLMEEYYILLYNAPYSDDFYNIIAGAAGSSNNFTGKTSKEMEDIGKKISGKLKGKMVGEKNPMYGTHVNKGIKRSEETKQKLREIGSKRTGEKNSRYGAILSEDTRLKISKALKGKHEGSKNPRARKVVFLDNNYKIVKTFDCLKDVYEYCKNTFQKPNSGTVIKKCMQRGLQFNSFYIQYKSEVKNVQ